ncbi:MAG: TatD family hydrolase [Planctomycetota bacterium]|nr:TatD family hydrolase [Planctomycetota bacterium]
MPLIDSHAHVNFDAFDDDRDDVYARARAAGVEAIVEVGVGLEGSRRAIARAQEVPMVHAAAGLHPTDVATWNDDWEPFLELVRTGAPKAVGECGLDYYWMKAEKETQADAFRAQLDLARDVGLPFIVHCRDAEADLIAILSDHGYARGVVHCFGGSADEARTLVELGLHVSFCGNVTYKNAKPLRAAARAVPVERLLLETDSPFLPPQARRGKRNEPAFVRYTAEFLAELKGVSFDELTETTTRNARALFDLQ